MSKNPSRTGLPRPLLLVQQLLEACNSIKTIVEMVFSIGYRLHEFR
jgi:hypothetical protein